GQETRAHECRVNKPSAALLISSVNCDALFRERISSRGVAAWSAVELRETVRAASVTRSGLILIMVSLWDGPGPVPKVYGLKAAGPWAKGVKEGRTFRPHDGLRLPVPCQRRS